VTLVEGDIAAMNLGKQFDVVYSIGVLHHTDFPDASFKNIAKHCKPGGRVIVWVYSAEGNALNRWFVEPLKVAIVHKMPRKAVLLLAKVLTALVYIPVYSLYLLPLRFLPYYEYFENWRKLSFERNVLNVFDKLNAPQTWFITGERVQEWFSDREFTDVSITPYKGVSWRGSGTKR
jgi:SAM-dependent methyltransferase